MTIDLPAYLRFVGLDDEVEPTVSDLGRLQRAHADTIRFSTVPYALGREPALDLEALQQRIVVEGRGGTCLEQVPLFAAVLDALGFETEVRASESRGASSLSNHLVLLVKARDDERRWLTNVGCDAAILAPVPLPASPGVGEVVEHLCWEQRAEVNPDGSIALMERGPPPSEKEWRWVHATATSASPAPPGPAAAERRLLAARTTSRGRERLDGCRLELYLGAAEPYVEDLSPVSAVEMLTHRFRVVVDAEERAGLIRHLQQA